MKKFLIALLFSLPSLIFAQGSQVNTQSLKLVGMGGAGSALFADESSMAYNPGAMVYMDHNAVQIGVTGIMFRSAFRETGADDYHKTKFKISPPVNLYATFGPKDAWWKAGIAVYTPYGGGVDWGSDWPGRFALNYLNMRAFYIQPTASFKIAENFSLGGGFIYNIGTVDLGRSIPAYFQDGSTASAELSGVGTGMGFNLGALYVLEDQVSVGLSYRSEVKTKLESGDAVFNVPSSVAANFPNTKFSAELPLPSTFTLALGIPLSDRVDLALDGTITNYSTYESLKFDYETDLIPDTESPKEYENAFSGKVGVNYQVNDILALRAGGSYIKSPVRSPYMSPETPDADRMVASLGVTYELTPKWELNAAYAFQHLMPRRSNNIETGLSGMYKTYVHAPGLSLVYKY